MEDLLSISNILTPSSLINDENVFNSIDLNYIVETLERDLPFVERIPELMMKSGDPGHRMISLCIERITLGVKRKPSWIDSRHEYRTRWSDLISVLQSYRCAFPRGCCLDDLYWMLEKPADDPCHDGEEDGEDV